jgi:peptidoglycan/LPS O-acetylase OafA/YrhL
MSEDRQDAAILGVIGLGVVVAAWIAHMAFDSRDLTWNLLTLGVGAIALAGLDWVGIGEWVRRASSRTRWLLTALIAVVIAAGGTAYLLWPTYERWWLAEMVACVVLLLMLNPTQDEEGGQSTGGGFDGPWGPP